jgi:hypothetical protein
MSLPERDWKYLRSIEPELLAELCRRINQQAGEILSSPKFENDHLKYLALYRHLNNSDKIVANCFNDWRRSTISLIIRLLQQQKLLTEEHVSKLSEDAVRILSGR